MSAKRGWRKAILKAVLVCVWAAIAYGPAHRRCSAGFVQDVDAVPSAMATRDTLSLTVDTHVQAAHTSELTHRVLLTAKDCTTGAHGYSALYSSMNSAASWGESRSLIR